MLFRILLLLSLLGVELPLMAYGQIQTLPPELYKSMKSGKKLNNVWTAPGFDGSQGLVIGEITNQALITHPAAKELLTSALRRAGQPGAPFTLKAVIVEAETRFNSQGNAEARMAIEGRVTSQGGELVAAFYTREMCNYKGSERDNLGECANLIAAGLVKEFGLATTETFGPVPIKKPSAVMYSGQGMPGTSGAGTSPKAAPPKMLPAVKSSQLAVAPELLPAAMPDSPEPMMKGKHLSKIWISPDYDKSKGFTIGELSYRIAERDSAVSACLPSFLMEISVADSPFTLMLAVVALTREEHGSLLDSKSSAALSVEGRILTRDGRVVVAFQDRAYARGTGDLSTDMRQCVKGVVADIKKDLR